MFDKINIFVNNEVKEEVEDLDDIDNIIDTIFKKFFSLNVSQQAMLGVIIFGSGIFTQFLFISSFLGGGIDGVYLLNIQSAISFSLLFIFLLLVSTFLPLLFILIFPLSLILAIFGFDLSNHFNYLIPIILIISLLLFTFQWYRKLFLIIIIYLVGFGFLLNSLYYANKDVTIKSENGSFTGKLYFSNGENYFLERDGKKLILPINKIEEIEYK